MAGNLDEFKITVRDEGEFLRVTLIGPGSLPNLFAALQRIIAETKSRDIWRVLVDATGVPPPLGTSEKYDLGLETARVADPRMKSAVVARSENVDHFFETVARNRGVSVMVFLQENAAISWLLDRASR
jgi:hypothetical protein